MIHLLWLIKGLQIPLSRYISSLFFSCFSLINLHHSESLLRSPCLFLPISLIFVMTADCFPVIASLVFLWEIRTASFRLFSGLKLKPDSYCVPLMQVHRHHCTLSPAPLYPATRFSCSELSRRTSNFNVSPQ